MEKKPINFSLRTFITKFQRAHRENISPSMLWRTAIWGGFIGIIFVSIFAYITYNWALSVESSNTPPRISRDVFSLTELKEVIASYHQKEVNFASLQERAPQAPEYQRTKGVIATTTVGLELDETVDIVSPPARTQ